MARERAGESLGHRGHGALLFGTRGEGSLAASVRGRPKLRSSLFAIGGLLTAPVSLNTPRTGQRTMVL